MAKNILFLCTGNSARSIMAETYMNHASANRWLAHSAGSNPIGAVNPFALTTLKNSGIIPVAPASKSWDVFANSPIMDVVVTVCDNAAGETCPIWPGTPDRYHWSFADPAAIAGNEDAKLAAFERIFLEIKLRINQFLRQDLIGQGQ